MGDTGFEEADRAGVIAAIVGDDAGRAIGLHRMEFTENSTKEGHVERKAGKARALYPGKRQADPSMKKEPSHA